MELIVRKYGGSSVADASKMNRIARHLARMHRDGRPIAVVVSAMGDMTDRLVDHVTNVAGDPSPRELDLVLSSGEQISSGLLAMAIQARGAPAVALTGRQAGIITDEQHMSATIEEVRPDRVREALDGGCIPVIAGYQGITRDGDTTTLGRGGSDTTAVALAGALGAARCDICTDVDGVYSADPRIVPGARRLPEISYASMEPMARLGAGVLHAPAVAEGRKRDVVIRVRKTFDSQGGTTVSADGPRPLAVTGRGGAALVEFEAGQDGEVADALARLDVLSTTGSGGGPERLLVAGADEPGAAAAALAASGAVVVEGGLAVVALVGDLSTVGLGAGHLANMLQASGVPVLEQRVEREQVLLAVAHDEKDAAMRALHRRCIEVIAA